MKTQLFAGLLLVAAHGCAAPAVLTRVTRPDESVPVRRTPAVSSSAPALLLPGSSALDEDDRPGTLDLGATYRAASTADANGKPQLGSGPEQPLMSWDGDVVQGDLPGNAVEDTSGARGLEPSPSGRMYIIELYQQVLDERDGLAVQVKALEKALAETRASLRGSSESLQQWEARVVELEAGYLKLEAENRELAARLTTAQIRRLEAEKLLLEAQIRWHRSAEGSAEEAGDQGATSQGDRTP